MQHHSDPVQLFESEHPAKERERDAEHQVGAPARIDGERHAAKQLQNRLLVAVLIFIVTFALALFIGLAFLPS